jgi:hypothetical protein
MVHRQRPVGQDGAREGEPPRVAQRAVEVGGETLRSDLDRSESRLGAAAGPDRAGVASMPTSGGISGPPR